MSAKFNSEMTVIGIDIGKNSFHIVGLDRRGAIALRQKWSRGQVETRLANLPPCLIGMEACVGAHHLSRKLTSLGHDARLMPAKYVRPYSRGQKNDFRDAEAIAPRPAAFPLVMQERIYCVRMDAIIDKGKGDYFQLARCLMAWVAADASSISLPASIAVSLPLRLRMRPSIRTVSTFDACAESTSPSIRIKMKCREAASQLFRIGLLPSKSA